MHMTFAHVYNEIQKNENNTRKNTQIAYGRQNFDKQVSPDATPSL